MSKRTSPGLAIPLSLSFLGFVFVGLAGGANGVVLPSISSDYHVNDAVIGLLFLVSSIGYFLSALASGPLTERLGVRWFVILGTLILFIGQLGFGVKLPFALLLLARLLIGLGIGIIETGFNVFITALPRQTTQLNFLHAFYGVGSLLGPLMSSAILTLAWGWNTIYLIMAGLNVLMTLGLFFFFYAPQTGPATSQNKESKQDNVLSSTLKLPIVWFASFFLLIYVGIEVSLGNWGYSFLLEARQQGTLQSGWIVSGYWLGLTLGRFTIQVVAEKLGIGIRELMYGCIGGVIAGVLLVWFVPGGVAAALGFGFIGFSLAPIYPLTVAILPKLVPARFGPSAIGLLVSVSIIGLALFPWIAGILAQAQGIWTLLPYMLVLSVIMLLSWVYLGQRTAKESSREEAPEQVVEQQQ